MHRGWLGAGKDVFPHVLACCPHMTPTPPLVNKTTTRKNLVTSVARPRRGETRCLPSSCLVFVPLHAGGTKQVGVWAPWGGEGPHGGVHAGSTVHVRVSD